ncbi:MAG: PhzF family phenazine biosynthesis protein [Bacteroidota bacterium]
MKTYFVDAFTNAKFKGNPAAVCIVVNDLDNTTMQNIAAEIGFSETAFIKKISGDIYSIRFYTPKQEIPLCGHATLAASKIIFDTTAAERIVFVNVDNVELKAGKTAGKIAMEFPVYETCEIIVPASVLDAIGIDKTINTRFSENNKIILIEIAQADTLAKLKPDFQALLNSYSGINGVLVTAPSDTPDFDFHYRYFWPWTGTNEDPVTGGVQTFLTKYWATKLQKNKLKVFQSSARTGHMTTELLNGKVMIYGDAITVFEGEFIN